MEPEVAPPTQFAISFSIYWHDSQFQQTQSKVGVFSHWAYMINDTAAPNYGCCTAMNRWSDLIGETCIYNIMGETA